MPISAILKFVKYKYVRHCIAVYDIKFYSFKVIERSSKPNVHVTNSQETRTFAMVFVRMMYSPDMALSTFYDNPFLKECHVKPFLEKCYDASNFEDLNDEMQGIDSLKYNKTDARVVAKFENAFMLRTFQSVRHYITIYDIRFYHFKVIEKSITIYGISSTMIPSSR